MNSALMCVTKYSRWEEGEQAVCEALKLLLRLGRLSKDCFCGYVYTHMPVLMTEALEADAGYFISSHHIKEGPDLGLFSKFLFWAISPCGPQGVSWLVRVLTVFQFPRSVRRALICSERVNSHDNFAPVPSHTLPPSEWVKSVGYSFPGKKGLKYRAVFFEGPENSRNLAAVWGRSKTHWAEVMTSSLEGSALPRLRAGIAKASSNLVLCVPAAASLSFRSSGSLCDHHSIWSCYLPAQSSLRRCQLVAHLMMQKFKFLAGRLRR